MTTPTPEKGHVAPYTHPAAGWGALKQVAINLVKEKVAGGKYKTLFKQNQPDGFDCPGCAWPDRQHASTFEFCENGVKAVAAEATSKRVTNAFFAQYTVTELMRQSDYELEQHGRLTHPVRYDAATDKYVPVDWDEAFRLIADHLRRLDDPDRATFYTSGRASNEAAFLFQLFVRMYGTNNFPDCSNMCHEATSRGLPVTVGVGKATVVLDDFQLADTIMVFGQNPATNHPRMLNELRDAAKRGATIVSINPLKERGLERFTSPQHVSEMLTGGSTKIATMFVRPKLAGDFALLKGMGKRVIELDDAAIATAASVWSTWISSRAHRRFRCLRRGSARRELGRHRRGVRRDARAIDGLADVYVHSERTIACWGMGLTQHKESVRTIQLLSNVMMLRGNIGRPGAGLMPVRGHSTCRATARWASRSSPTTLSWTALAPRSISSRRAPTAGRGGRDQRDAGRQGQGVRPGRQLLDRHARHAPHVGGAAPVRSDRQYRHQAQPQPSGDRQGCAVAADAGPHRDRRAERRAAGRDGRGLGVHGASLVRHEQAGIAAPAVGDRHRGAHGRRHARLGQGRLALVRAGLCTHPRRDRKGDSGLRALQRARGASGWFSSDPGIAQPRLETASGKAQFLVHAIDKDTPIKRARARYGDDMMVMMTTRSHDQYNTTIYGLDDRYRGVYGLRRVVFIHPADRARLGFAEGEHVDITSVWEDGVTRHVQDFRLVDYDIPEGCLGAYYPETNPLVPLESIGDRSGTPTSKSIPVLLRRAG
jgi:anaerobic selenocysteine-containing dehydrogenase